MANKQVRSPGALQRYDLGASVGGVPSSVVARGDVASALANVGGSLAARLSAMADKAAAREGDLAGLNAGQRAGAAYVEREAAEVSAAQRLGRPELAGVTPAVTSRLEALEAALGERVTVTSGARSERENIRVGGASNSTHRTGDGIDIATAGLSQEQIADRIRRASEAGFTGIGVEGDHIHLDVGGRRAWGPDHRSSSVPAWAQSEIAAHLNRQGASLPVPAPAATGVRGGVDNTPLQLRRDGTIRGEAFDRAAISTWSWRMQSGLATDLAEAHQQFLNDPAGYERAIASVRAGYLDNPSFADPELAEVFDRVFTERVAADRLHITAQQEIRLRNEEAAAIGEGMDALAGDLERQAFNLGGNPRGDELIAPQIARFNQGLANAVEDGVITAQQAAAQRQGLNESVARARITGTFEALPTPAQKEGFALALMEEWSSGEGPLAHLSYDQANALSNTLFGRARTEANRVSAETRAEQGRVRNLIADDIASMEASGEGIDLDEAELTPGRVTELVGEGEAASWRANRDRARRIWQASAGMETENAAEIVNRLEALVPRAGQPGYADQQQILAAAAQRAQEVLAERERDPLGQAARGGAIGLSPIDTTSPANLKSSLEMRVEQARVVAGLYGTPLTVFRPTERQALANAFLEQPDLLPAFAIEALEIFGDDAPRALGELSEAGPAIAHAAGLAAATGDASVATDIARTLAGRDEAGWSADMPSDATFAETANALVGPTMMALPKTQQAAIGVAALIFEREANLMGLDPDDIDEPGTPAHAAYARALNRALGASTSGGEQFGGLGTVNDFPIIVPADMKATRPAEILASLTQDMLAELPPIATGNGVPVTASQLRAAHLVTVGDGVYRVALGDPSGSSPQYLITPGGDFWTLDIRAAERLMSSTPYLDYVRGVR